MIRLFVFCLCALGIGVFLQLQFADDPGYVLISFKGYDIEATLSAAVIASLAVFVVFYGGVWLLKTINPLNLFSEDSWFIFSRRKRARIRAKKGMQLLLLGEWQQSYKLLVESAENVESPLFNYLAASMAAVQHGDKVSWAFCLDQAERSSRSSARAIKNLKAMMELEFGRTEQSLAIFLTLKKETPNSTQVLGMLKDIYFSMSDWEKLWELLPELEKNKVINSEELYSLTESAILFRLEKAGKNSLEEINSIWKNTPKQLKENEKISERYLRTLLENGYASEALTLLTRFLKRHWNDALIDLFGFSYSDDPGSAVLIFEGYMKSRPNNANLALALGRMSLRKQLWGKSREYFQTALQLSNEVNLTAEINAELARLLDSLGEYEKSVVCYRQAMKMLNCKLPDLPMPVTGGLQDTKVIPDTINTL